MSPRRSSRRHAERSWICDCGRILNGNGGISSHRRACPTWKRRLLERLRRAVAEIEAMQPDERFFRFEQSRLPELRRRVAQLEEEVAE